MNCHHVFPDLAKLEKAYRQELVVIGVHSAKFDHEKVSRSIRQAVQRFDLRHPVINDAEMAIWERWGVHVWPTLALIDPEGFVIGAVTGEGHYELLDGIIRDTIKAHDAKGTLSRRKLDFGATAAASGPLRFPGKVCARPPVPAAPGGAPGQAGRLFIADTNHHRIVVANLDGTVEWIAGDGTPGRRDGPAPKARFRYPQGLWAAGDRCWVADTENHAIRELDLPARTVRTIAGTGQRVHREGGGDATLTPLNSPWDVVLDPERQLLYVAMAGQHQLWAYDFQRKLVAPFAGDRAERLRDGRLSEASFNQPCGLALDGDRLYVADCEASALRLVDLEARRVATLVGIGLFDWGDVDGAGTDARLQHPLQVAWDAAGSRLFIADAYNHKVKTFDPATLQVKTFAAGFNEPGGLALAGGALYVADTNNHRIRVLDLKTRKARTLALKGLAPPPAPK